MTGCTDCGWSYMDKCKVYEDGTCRRDHDFDDPDAEEKEDDRLKPCPFCGGEANIRESSDAFSAVFYEARCKKCNVNVIVYADMTKSIEWNKKKCIEKWNTRKEKECIAYHHQTK